MVNRRPFHTGRGRPIVLVCAVLLPLALLIAITGCGGGNSRAVSGAMDTAATSDTAATDRAFGPPPAPGDPLPGLGPNELARFKDGRSQFMTIENPADGLGPVFNGRSCAECHRQGAIGGAAFDTTESVVTRFGGLVNGQYSDLPEKGGPVVERRSLHEIDPTNPARPEVVPPEAQFVSHRTTTPLFGAGLIEAIPDDAIRKLADPDDKDHDGISGRVNLVTNPETHRTEVGRFGWKAQVSSLTVFAADAYLNEMGVTTPLFPNDLLPQGKFVPGADRVADPEDHDGDAQRFADFMRFLAPPPARVTAQTQHGKLVFQQVGCVSCHVAELTTGDNPVPALAHKSVPLYSDLLLHDMGSGLADGIRQGDATGAEFRTAPLWGMGLRKFYLHDGRARSVPEAIGWHGGEASRVIDRYSRLSRNDVADLVAFVGSL